MDNLYDVPDPSDWLETPVSRLGPVEAALRCQVCKDFFNTPMITSCSHTFCSLCIRRCLTTDGICPTCRAQDQEIKLRSNAIVQELVDAFQTARPTILQLGKEAKAMSETSVEKRGSLKRKLRDTDMAGYDSHGAVETQGRRTRSQHGMSPTSRNLVTVQTGDDSNDEDFLPDDGLTACPICSARMKEEAVFSHLDIHSGTEMLPKTGPRLTRSPHFDSSSSVSHAASKAMERLPQWNYSLLKDNALRKKLSELGIPNAGPRGLLTRRHTEWINLVNANCDSTKPRTKRELLHDLDLWDKTQGRQILQSSHGGGSNPSVMHKDFDGDAWAASHDQDFQALIAKARKKISPQNGASGDSDEARNAFSNHNADNVGLPIESPKDSTRSNESTSPPHPRGDTVTLREKKSRPPHSSVGLEADG